MRRHSTAAVASRKSASPLMAMAAIALLGVVIPTVAIQAGITVADLGSISEWLEAYKNLLFLKLLPFVSCVAFIVSYILKLVGKHKRFQQRRPDRFRIDRVRRR